MNTFTSDGDTIYEVRVLVQDTELFSDTICFLLTNTELLMSDTETFAAEIYHLQSVVDALQKELKKRNYIVVVYALLYCFVVPVMAYMPTD